MKYETLYISGKFVKFECQAHLHKRKAPLLTPFWRRFCIGLLMWRKNTNLTSSDYEEKVWHCSKKYGPPG